MEVRCHIKVDNNLAWQSHWRAPSINCWDSKVTLEVSQARELWIQVYWRRVYPVSASGSTNTIVPGTLLGNGTPSTGGGDPNNVKDDAHTSSDWVLAAVQ